MQPKSIERLGFGRYRYVPEKTAAPSRGRMASMGPAELVAAPKIEAIEHEGYRRLVAQLPCIACRIYNFSQCAHTNTGKGLAVKTCDLQTFPLCCDRPGVRGCHSLFDQGALFSKAARRAIEPAWVADTQRQILTLGWWPADLPIPETAS